MARVRDARTTRAGSHACVFANTGQVFANGAVPALCNVLCTARTSSSTFYGSRPAALDQETASGVARASASGQAPACFSAARAGVRARSQRNARAWRVLSQSRAYRAACHLHEEGASTGAAGAALRARAPCAYVPPHRSAHPVVRGSTRPGAGRACARARDHTSGGRHLMIDFRLAHVCTCLVSLRDEALAQSALQSHATPHEVGLAPGPQPTTPSRERPQ
eukprot:6565416-Prymnesium_polylepis.1